MDFTSFNTEIATQPKWPEVSYTLTEEELEDLWFFYNLEFGHLLGFPGPGCQDITRTLGHLPSSCASHPSSNNANDAALTHSLGAAHNYVPGPGSSVIPEPSLGERGPVLLEYEAILAELNEILGTTSCSAASSIPATGGNAKVVPATTLMANIAHRKRHRNVEESYGDIGSVAAEDYERPRHKRVRGEGEASGGILGAAQYMARTRRRPETRVPKTKNNYTSKEAGRGVEGHTTPNTQGVYHHSLLGPSFQQGWALINAQGRQLSRAEERVEEEASHRVDNTVQQENGSHLVQIPSMFDERYRVLLAVTESDWARRAVDQIKCRLCPNRRFGKWDDFQRHCKTTEAHPVDIHFCGGCGDFFARTDSLKRHLSRPPAECLDVTPERAEEKRRETVRVHGDFMESLTTGEAIGTPFAHTIKQMFPESSKKRTGSGWERRRVQA